MSEITGRGRALAPYRFRTVGDTRRDRILTSETALALTEVLVVGWRQDGTMHLAMSDPGMDRALMLLICAQRRLVDEVVAP